MESISDESRAAIKELSDGELLRMVGVDSSDYRPEALAYAREELERRNVRIPEAGAAAPLPNASGPESTSAPSAKKNPFAGLSMPTRILFVATAGYALIARLGRFREPPVRIHPAWGGVTISALLWSLAWDARNKSSEPVAGVPQEPKWPGRLVIVALLFTAATLYLLVYGSF